MQFVVYVRDFCQIKSKEGKKSKRILLWLRQIGLHYLKFAFAANFLYFAQSDFALKICIPHTRKFILRKHVTYQNKPDSRQLPTFSQTILPHSFSYVIL